jgi:hypothetical protein
MPVILALWAATSLSYPTNLIQNVQPEESANVTSDDELSWYKPVAVILKPATQRDFQELLESDRMDELLHPSFSRPAFYQQRRSSYWPSPAQDSWGEFGPAEELPPYYEGRHYERPDRLREAYNRFDLPEHLQSNLLSLARMGLMAIPTKEIGGRKNDATEELSIKITNLFGYSILIGVAVNAIFVCYYLL